MHDKDALRDRYLRDGPSVRLGGLAANLARVSTRCSNPANSAAVHGIIEESKWFIEWTAAIFVTDSIDTAARLVLLQIKLSCWQIGWDARWRDPDTRAAIASESKMWSDQVLEMSGLLG
jgi:hypothetical protein